MAGQPARLLGQGGNEYFLGHLVGTDHAVRATEAPPDARPRYVVWRDEAPTGKLDLLLLLLLLLLTSTTIYSDVVLPAATWYEKHDLNTTDMHPGAGGSMSARPPTPVPSFSQIPRAASSAC